MNLSIIIPTFNEEHRIASTLDVLVHYIESQNINGEIIVVDDGSTDNTVEIVSKAYNPYIPITILCQPKRQGKGAAVKRGMLFAHGEMLLFTDADLSTPIEELSKLIKAVDEGADVAIGSRGLKSSMLEVRQPFYREMMGKTFNRIVQILLIPGIYDTQCGFKLFTWEAAQTLFKEQKLSGFEFDVELLYMARKKGYYIKEIPVRWKNEPHSKVNVIVDSLKMLLSIVTIRYIHREL